MPRPHRRPAPTPALDPVLDFLRLLWSIEHALERISKKMNNDLGITGPQRLVLRIVGRFPGISAGELAEIVRLHPSTITGILQRLVERGWVDRRPDPSDTRRARLRLKRSAVRFTQRARGTVELVVRQALENVGGRKVGVSRDVLREIADRLNAL